MGFSSYLHDKTAVRRGAEISPLIPCLKVFPGASLGDVLLAIACPIQTVTLWEGLL